MLSSIVDFFHNYFILFMGIISGFNPGHEKWLQINSITSTEGFMGKTLLDKM